MITIKRVELEKHDEIKMQMAENGDVLCEGQAVVRDGCAHIIHFTHTQFMFEVSKAILNCIDLHNIKHVYWKVHGQQDMARQLGFTETEEGLYLNLQGYFGKQCHAVD